LIFLNAYIYKVQQAIQGDIIRYLTTLTQTKINIDSNIESEMIRITIKGIHDTNLRTCQDSIQDLCTRTVGEYSAHDIRNSKNNFVGKKFIG